MAAATPFDWFRPNPPLEHQFLPPSLHRPASWGDDAARLQQLMLGSPSSARPAASALRDLGGLFDFDSHQPLPSGWERCLDLKSGEVYLVKSDSKGNGASERKNRSHSTQPLDSTPRMELAKVSKKLADKDTREDWSLRWLQDDTAASSERTISTSKCFKQQEVVNLIGEDEERKTVRQEEREALCLDLDLKLTNKHQPEARKSCTNRDTTETAKTSSGKRNFVDRPQSETLVSAAKLLTSTACTRVPAREENNITVQPQQQWRWRLGENSNPEVARESTMATSVCSSCLMYVVLRKTNPTCPRCANPIILDCSSHRSSKRSRSDITPDDLSLSTDFSM